ncbi:MAG: hypothetical protein R6U78_16190 [Bacteroidales bacterium]
MALKNLIGFLVLSVLLINGCRRSAELPETMQAHYLKYQVNYLDEQAGAVPTRILPQRMDAYYTRYHILTRIEGFLSQFALVQITDLRQRRVTTLLNFFGTKVYYTGENGELPAGIIEPVELTFRYTGDTTTIAGLKSERIEVDTGTEKYDIYLTREFNARKPNMTTPYHSIDHALSDFRIQLSLLKMHLTCLEYKIKTVESEIFMIPEDYEPVSRQAMEEIINSLFTKE